MKIAQLVSNYYKVSPQTNQAIYSHVAWLTNGLTGNGNEVTLFGAAQSEVNAKVHGIDLPEGAPEEVKKNYTHLLISECYKNAALFDIIHSHFNLLTSYYSGLSQTPTVQSFHSPIADASKPILKRFKDNNYISFSLAQRKQMPELNWVANIYHGIDMQKFNFNPHPKDYFLYLGRITEDKGVHLAIEAAQAANIPLVIAGRSYPEEGYWHEKIEKNIDGKMVTYVGEADFDNKIEYIKNAKALLFPTQYDEVFGLVMIEAMACGTPVIGWNSGSVPEVIEDKYTGFVVNSVENMVKAIGNIDKISREACRHRAEKLFSVEKMVSGYEKVYLKVIEDLRNKNPKQTGDRQITRL